MSSDSETLISEGDVPRYLKEYLENAISLIQHEKYEEALHYLIRNEELLEAVATQGATVDNEFVLVTIHNIALCYQKLGMLEQCGSYLDGCLYNMKHKKVKIEDIEKHSYRLIADRIFKAKYECKSHMQLCAIMSQLNKHQTALSHAKMAVKKAHMFIIDSYNVCQEYMMKYRKGSIKRTLKLKSVDKTLAEESSNQIFHDLIMKTMPTLENIFNKLTHKRSRKMSSKPAKIELRSVLGVQHFNDWIHSFNIGDLMIIEMISLQDVQTSQAIQTEFVKDLMLEKICMLIVSYFCIATEIRFILADKNTTFKAKEGELWHRKAIDIAKECLPADCPLITHLDQSFIRNYSEKANRRKSRDPPKAPKRMITKKTDISFNYKYRETAKTPTPTIVIPQLRSSSAKPTNSKLLRPKSSALKRNPIKSLQEADSVLPSIAKDLTKDEEIKVTHQDYSFGNTQSKISGKNTPTILKTDFNPKEILSDRPHKIGISLEKLVNKDLSYDISIESQLSNIDSTRILDNKSKMPVLISLQPPSMSEKLEIYAKRSIDQSKLYESFPVKKSNGSSYDSREEADRLFTEPNDRERIVISSNDLYGIYSSESESEDDRSVDYSQISNEERRGNYSIDSKDKARFHAIFERIQGRIATELNQSSTGGNT